ncbi:DUF362 domain-containing protein, partial [bacterium]|nr:DUF362 domain-containing protein [bacterium]
RPDYRFNPAVSTDPRVIIALSSYLNDIGAAKTSILDNPGVGLTLRRAVETFPGRQFIKELGVDFVYPDEYPVEEIELPDSTLFKRMKVPTVLKEFSRFINLPKLKMHMHVGASLGIKNLYGLLLDEQRMTFHRQDVNWKLIEILREFTPDLTIIDGIWALEGQAPICGDPVKDFNTLIAGEDPVAVDSAASAVMGIEPEELATTRLAHTAKMGTMRLDEIEISGAGINSVKRIFKRPVVSSMGVYPNCIVYELGACVGCMSSLRHALDRMHFGGDLHKMPSNTYILGIPGPFYEPLSIWEGGLHLIGDCPMNAYPESSGIFRITGCPPHFIHIMNELKRINIPNEK